MKAIHLPSPNETAALGTAGLRDSFLLEDLFRPGELTMVATDLDRAVVGAAVPTGRGLELSCPQDLRAAHFCERRELGVLNLGGPGTVTVDGDGFDLGARECLYVGRMMGQPRETRPLWVADRQAVLAPAWSIHCGCGTAAYRFAWAMGGENQAFTDMDGVAINELR